MLELASKSREKLERSCCYLNLFLLKQTDLHLERQKPPLLASLRRIHLLLLFQGTKRVLKFLKQALCWDAFGQTNTREHQFLFIPVFVLLRLDGGFSLRLLLLHNLPPLLLRSVWMLQSLTARQTQSGIYLNTYRHNKETQRQHGSAAENMQAEPNSPLTSSASLSKQPVCSVNRQAHKQTAPS